MGVLVKSSMWINWNWVRDLLTRRALSGPEGRNHGPLGKREAGKRLRPTYGPCHSVIVVDTG